MSSAGGLQYRPEIDGLRAVAVLMVVAYHAMPSLVPGGFVGVDVFFVISGFLITRIIAADVAAGTFTFTDFYLRRCRRILPALSLVLLATWALGFALLTAYEFKGLGRHVVAGATFSSNILLWTETGYFDGPASSKPLLHLWSLGVEEQYYFLWPLAVAVLLARPRTWSLAAVAVIAAVSLSIGLLTTVTSPGAAFYLLPARFWELLAGAMLALAGGNGLAALRWPGREFAAAAGLGVIAASALLMDSTMPFPGWRAMVPVAGALLVLAVGDTSWINRQLLSMRPMVFIGLISYPLYLWHWPLLSLFAVIKDDLALEPGHVKWVRLALVGVSMVLAALTYYLLERPAQALVRRYSGSRPAKVRAIAALVSILLSVGAIGGVTVASQGMAFRHEVLDPASYDRQSRELTLEYFNDFLDRFPACTGPYADLPGNLWCHQTDADRPSVAVIGDSHARALFPGFAQAERDLNARRTLLAARCATLLDVTVIDQPECLESNRLLLTALAADTAIDTVVLASRGPLYTTGRGFGAIEAGIGKAMQSASRAAAGASRPAMFLDGYSAAVATLIAAGKQVVFVVNVPELGFTPQECLASRPFKSGGLRRPCAVRLADVEARQLEYRQVVASLAERHPGLRVFDAQSVLCDGELCYAERQGSFIYNDSNHLGVDGSRLVGQALARFVAPADRAAAPK
jgi:peptidoglycan/LPS O-acetylase OafA/YrhL